MLIINNIDEMENKHIKKEKKSRKQPMQHHWPIGSGQVCVHVEDTPILRVDEQAAETSTNAWSAHESHRTTASQLDMQTDHEIQQRMYGKV